MTTRAAVWRADTRDMAAHFAIRHRVFVEEQGVLVFTDIDHHDGHEQTIHVLAACGCALAGTVRLYPVDDDGRWRGDRLAVLKAQRASMLGAHLVRFAVATAAAQGGTAMEASVQLPNVSFFERLGWRTDGEVYQYVGLPHRPMLFDLADARPLPSLPRPATPVLDASFDAASVLLTPTG